MVNLLSSPILTNVTFSGNSAATGGGGMTNADSNPTLTNVTFSGNSTNNIGGGMYNHADFSGGSHPTLTNVTFSGNSAGSAGGAMYNSLSNPIIRNSILYGNTGGEISNFSSAPIVNYSIVQGGYAGTGNLDANPLLNPLANNGGFTQTMALKNGSPAIDAGNDAKCPAKDQRGVTRPQRAHCDMGAYEAPGNIILRSAGTSDGWVLESTETSSTGGTMNNMATTFNLGDNAANKQYRALLSFNTSSLPDNAIINKVTLRIKKNSVVGGGDPLSASQGLKVDIKKGVFGTVALQLGDFNASPSQSYGPFSPPLSGTGWYRIDLSSGRGYINKIGSTQFRLRFTLDDNNNDTANFLRLFSGNAATTDRPQLIIEYYAR
jgi:predicted outer membrane repeat protein